MRFYLCEGLFDRIEVGTIGRQVAQLRAGHFDHLSYVFALVSWKVVDNHDVAWLEGGRDTLAEVFDEDRPVHRTVDGERRLDGILPQCGNEGHGFPMTPRNAANHSAAALRAAVQSRHLGRRSGLVDEDKFCRVK